MQEGLWYPFSHRPYLSHCTSSSQYIYVGMAHFVAISTSCDCIAEAQQHSFSCYALFIHMKFLLKYGVFWIGIAEVFFKDMKIIKSLLVSPILLVSHHITFIKLLYAKLANLRHQTNPPSSCQIYLQQRVDPDCWKIALSLISLLSPQDERYRH